MNHANLSRGSTRQCTDDPRLNWADGVADCAGRLVGQALSLPFDTARALHAAAARSGLIKKSILEGRDFEHTLAALEQFTLGPWARQV